MATQGTAHSRHIVLVGPAFPYRGGIAHFVDRLERELSSRGHQTDIISFRRLYPTIFFPGKTQFEPEPAASHADASRRMIDSCNPLSWRSSADAINEADPDIVVLNYWMPFFAPAMGTIARRVRRPGRSVVAIVHNAIPHERRPGDRMLTNYLLKRPDQLVALSRRVSDDLEQAFGVRSTVVPHPLYDHFGPGIARTEARSALDLPTDAPVLLFFGFVRHYKGLDLLLQAMPSIVESLPRARLVVAGEFYEDEELCRSIVTQSEMERHVTFHDGYVAEKDVRTYFSAADVVVQPYRSATQSGVAQISFFYDRPLITTDVGGLAEVVDEGQTGFIVKPNEPDELSRAVIRFFSGGCAAEMTENVGRAKHGFSWSVLAEALEEL
ncbi:MAG: glycosyltransferase [Rhodothermales bacterium]|nr:glycosyltransferase [Rhodothermales bacterium]